MKLVKLFLVFGMILLIGNVNAAYYVRDPANCPDEYQSQNPTTAGELLCGYTGGIAFWYDTSSLTAPVSSINSTTSYAIQDGGDGGYVVNCEGYDSVAPYCDNSENYWCDADSAYTNVNRKTVCTGGSFGASSGGTCISGYTYCDSSYTDADGCEIDIDTTAYPGEANAVYNSGCSPVCKTNYLDKNNNLGSAVDGCEILIGGSCTVGGLAGTYDSNGDCVGDKSYFETGTESTYSTSDPLLWGSQYGSGQLMNLTNGITNESFAINGSGCLIFPDGSSQCLAGGSDVGNVTGAGFSGRVAFWNSGSQLSSSNNLFWDNVLGRLGLGTTSPSSILHINGTPGDASEGISFGDGDTSIYESADDTLTFNFSTIGNWILDGIYFRSGSTGPRLKGITPDSTTPSIMPYGSDEDTGLGWAGSNKLSLIAGGINVLNVLNNSRVGIGTSSPGYPLEVVGDIYSSGSFIGDGSQLNGITGSQISNDLNWVNETYMSDYFNKTDILGFSYYNLTTWDNPFTYWNNSYYGGIGNWSEEKSDYWNTSNDLNFETNLNTTGNVSASWGFFNYIGSLSNIVTGLFVQNLTLNDTLSGNGSINISGNVSAENVFVDNDITVGGVLNVTGDINTNGDVCLNDGTCLSTVVDEALESSFNASYFYNKTFNSYNASLSFNNFTGYRAAHEICSHDFPGSHMCYESELMLTIDQGNISNITSWTGRAWIMAGGAKYSPADVPVNDCDGFTHGETSSYLGSFWIFDQTDGGRGGVGACSIEFPLACCKPGGII